MHEIESKGLDIKDLLPFHALTGCDTVEKICFIGKLKSFSILEKNKDEHLGYLFDMYNFEENYRNCVKFISKCYGINPCDTMNELRYKYWMMTIGKAKSFCPSLEKLPPTDSSFKEHVKRAMFQLHIWANADKRQVDKTVRPINWGWQIIDAQLTPITTPDNVVPAPESLLKLIKCSCKSVSNRCGPKSRCSCAINSLRCTVFCSCDIDGQKCTRYGE